MSECIYCGDRKFTRAYSVGFLAPVCRSCFIKETSWDEFSLDNEERKRGVYGFIGNIARPHKESRFKLKYDREPIIWRIDE